MGATLPSPWPLLREHKAPTVSPEFPRGCDQTKANMRGRMRTEAFLHHWDKGSRVAVPGIHGHLLLWGSSGTWGTGPPGYVTSGKFSASLGLGPHQANPGMRKPFSGSGVRRVRKICWAHGPAPAPDGHVVAKLPPLEARGPSAPPGPLPPLSAFHLWVLPWGLVWGPPQRRSLTRLSCTWHQRPGLFPAHWQPLLVVSRIQSPNLLREGHLLGSEDSWSWKERRPVGSAGTPDQGPSQKGTAVLVL